MSPWTKRTSGWITVTAALIAVVVGSIVAATGRTPASGDCFALMKAVAQRTPDVEGQADYKKYAGLRNPPLTPDQALARFEIEEDFRIELVASEPLIVDPVAMDIDPDGRLWVINMPSYNRMPMRDILLNTGERTPEREQAVRDHQPETPLGSVVVLEDTSGDGRMDTRRTFLDQLHQPRAIKVLHDGVLLAEPPHLYFVQDTTGDGRGDTREIISDQYAVSHVQHGPNSLLWGMDNWIYSANGFPSVRRIDGQWETRSMHQLGQWGLAQDDFGRLYSSTNSLPLVGHIVPVGYGDRHPRFSISGGKNEQLAPNGPVWPAHPTGVNRGYRVGEITREDGTIKTGAGIASTVIYRGGQFGDAYHHNAFTPVTAGNLIKRITLEYDPADLEVRGRFAYEQREFLTSTDERFRPINIYNASDGSLYIVDMYRGYYDDILFTTEHLRDYVLENELDEPTGMYGRIYRIVRDDQPVDHEPPALSELPPDELAERLTSEHGLVRDLAQQALVQCSPAEAVPVVRRLAVDEAAAPATRIHALWTLEGFDRSVFNEEMLTTLALEALDDEHPRVRAAAVRILEPAIRRSDGQTLARLSRLAEDDTAPAVQLQLLASLGESRDGATLATIAALIDRNIQSLYFRQFVLTAAGDVEAPLATFLRNSLHWDESSSDHHAWVLQQLDAAAGDPQRDLAHLDEPERELFERGQQAFASCMTCHGPTGQGVSGTGSALDGSPWVTGDADALVRIVLHGFDGGAAEREEDLPPIMPSHSYLTDENIAAILTYIRQSWSNDAPPILENDVARIRAETTDRRDIWTPAELRERLE